MEKKEILKQISSSLNLDYESQDWGIINSCPNRVKEFINYFNDNKKHPDTIKYELFELIVASFNDLILENNHNDEIINSFVFFINDNSRKPFLDILDYWKKIYNEEEFPVAKYWQQNRSDI